MEPAAVVAAFADSPKLRETLSVLLERDCRLHFVTGERPAPSLPADLGLVATEDPTGPLRILARQWPGLPVIVVDGQHGAPMTARDGGSGPYTVAFEPAAIRAAVRDHLVRAPVAGLSATVRLLGEALHAELRYPLAAVRSLSSLAATALGPATRPMLTAILHEQSYVLAATLEQLASFRRRPRSVTLSSAFVPALCIELQRSAAGAPAIVFDYAVDGLADAAPGPIALTETLAGFLRAYWRRCLASPVVRVHGTAHAISLQYLVRSQSITTASLPLVLCDVLLRPNGWRTRRDQEHDQETLRLVAVP